MLFSTVKRRLAKGGEFLHNLHLPDDEELLAVCAAALEHLSEDSDAYDEGVRFCSDRFAQFCEDVERLALLAERQADVREDDDIQALAFTLVEDMALFARERKLRCGCAPLSDAEEALMRFFEQNEEWRNGNGSLVADTYYIRLPNTVMYDMTRK